ncbi:TetR/AcrR family transcriptional regulator [Vibrio sp. 10N]|uniref:TetR/AcrR family transcriptional regulator n=1 Tax=Vibrio sp. 10N TaxID=3058938 RepID=UPI002813DE70|nr:TetR/AcrR family transcriptional regulator [Vibrio sp. 10N]
MTVNAKKRGRPEKGSDGLSQSRIVEMAKQMMQSNGKIPSIRGLATELNVDAMAIYHYFKNKDSLLEAVAVSLVEGIYQPNHQATWQHELTELGWSYLGLLREYSGLLETLFKMQSSGPAEVFIARFNDVVAPLTLSNDDKMNAVNLLADYLHGFAFSMQFAEVTQQEQRRIYEGSISLYLKAVTPVLPR